jgi:hypothetical protein
MAADVDFSVAAQEQAPSAAAAASAPLGSRSGATTGLGLAWAGVFVAFALFNQSAIDHLRAGEAAIHGRENGPLETVQLLAMLPALALFWFAGLKGCGAVRVAGVLLALVGSIAFVRELDLKTMMGTSAGFDWLAMHGLQDVIMGGLGLAMALYLWLQRRYLWGLVRLGLRWQAWPCAGALLLLAAAEIFLDGTTGTDGHFWEELVEANGYFLFTVAAWRHASLIGDQELDRPI